MTADTITAIKKALEAADTLQNYTDIDTAEGDNSYAAVKTIEDLASTIESLQRQNEESRELACAFEAEANQLREVSIANRHRAETAEAEVKRYREALHIISAGHACPIALANNALRPTALSSTGDTHGN
ncbi:hypothetical protein [Agrobacterium rubi]|uniref:hypothetical protein n=1 Tax=Agrobacterium rubi TaxID=28099 RepID=UPI0015749574|nr:hypothetical protein [Agrobacterium rubi]NTE87257.1 hypothetical protein [Agrobacterium rubi]NTF03191.1 hypothetical protein [Agrobacterium rubi]